MNYLALFFGQALNFLLIVVNIRACAQSRYLMVAVTDFVVCILNFTLFKLIAEAHSWGEALAYAAGGTAGSLFALWLTRRWDTT